LKRLAREFRPADGDRRCLGCELPVPSPSVVSITPTFTTVATSDLVGRVLEKERFATEPDATRMLGSVIEGVRKLSDRNKGLIEGVGISVPGLVDPGTGRAIFVPYFKWRDFAIADTIQKATGLAVNYRQRCQCSGAGGTVVWASRGE